MYIYSLTGRASSSTGSPGTYESSCQSAQPFQWCPSAMAIIFWVITGIALGCFIYFTMLMYSINRVGPTSSAQRSTRSNKKRYYRLNLPHPSSSPELSVESKDGYEQNTKEGDTSGSTLIDPYHVVHNLDDSLISKDAYFEGASVPQPALGQKRTGKLAGLGLGINMEGDSPISASPETSTGEAEKISTPPPARAHLHNARWDT